jgi:DHA1 family multidrug resistance protein-like MFS transporter
MVADGRGPVAAVTRPEKRNWRQAVARRVSPGEGTAVTLAIATGALVASMSMNFWIPFLPLFLKEIGARGDANALFWVGVATTSQGIARLAGGPFWGILSDRVGRKMMYIRALYFASLTTLIAAFATEPWHIAVAFTCQGLFSGFIPAAVALTSVSVPEHRLSNSLGLVTAAQYLGNTVGPALGAVLAIAFGLRGAIVAAAILPALAATMVVFVVPRDRTAATPPAATPGGLDPPTPATRPSVRALLTVQFGLAIFIYFFLFATSQLIRLTTPVALQDITGSSNVEGVLGIGFSIAGIASVVGVLFVARRWVTPGNFRRVMVIGALATAAAHVLLATSPNVALYILWFSVISLTQGALLPASNTLIAANAPRERRGTAFGFAGSAQALAFMAGPMSAAAFAAISLVFGYFVLAALFLGLGLLAWLWLREPRIEPGPKRS